MEFIYNNSVYNNTRTSLFRALYSYNPNIGVNAKDSVPEGKKVATTYKRIKIMQEEREDFINRLRKASIIYKKYYNKKYKLL